MYTLLFLVIVLIIFGILIFLSFGGEKYTNNVEEKTLVIKIFASHPPINDLGDPNTSWSGCTYSTQQYLFDVYFPYTQDDQYNVKMGTPTFAYDGNHVGWNYRVSTDTTINGVKFPYERLYTAYFPKSNMFLCDPTELHFYFKFTIDKNMSWIPIEVTVADTYEIDQYQKIMFEYTHI